MNNAILKSGERVGIVSCADFLSDNNQEEKALNYLRSLGLDLIISEHAVDPAARAESLMTFYRDRQIQAVFDISGGYGDLEVLDKLDFDIIKTNPKPFISLDEITALQNGITAQTGIVTYNGFYLPNCELPSGTGAQHFRNFFFEERNTLCKYFGGNVVSAGTTYGRLIGGNLEALCSLSDTGNLPPLNGKIIFLTENGKIPLQIEWMLNKLEGLPGFDTVRGVIFGTFANCQSPENDETTLDSVIRNFARRHRIPIVKDFPCGRISERYSLPIGKNVMLYTANLRCCIEA